MAGAIVVCSLSAATASGINAPQPGFGKPSRYLSRSDSHFQEDAHIKQQ